METRKKKVKTLLIILVIACLLSIQLSVCASSGFEALKSRVWGKGWQSRNYGESIYWMKRLGYAFASLDYSKEDFGFVIANFRNLVLVNPDVYGQEIKEGLRFILMMVQPLYVLSIAITGFYLIFITGSPAGRSKAKKFIKDLTVGMIVISMSPMLLQGLTNLSADITEAILNQTDVSVVTTNLETTFGKPQEKPIKDVAVDTIIGGITLGLAGDFFSIVKYIEAHTCTLCLMHIIVTFTEIELGYYTFLPFMLAIWGIAIYFFIRFAMITLFMIIFPLSVILYSFETTRAVGRNMLEQTIMWTFMQVFNAVVVVAVSLCIIQANTGIFSIKGIPSPLGEIIVGAFLVPVFWTWDLGVTIKETAEGIKYSPVVPYVSGAGAITTGATGLLSGPLVEFIPLVGCFIIVLAPLFIMRLFKGFLP